MWSCGPFGFADRISAFILFKNVLDCTTKVFASSLIGLFNYLFFSLMMAFLSCTNISLGLILRVPLKSYQLFNTWIQLQVFYLGKSLTWP